MKRCSFCKKKKDESEFYRHKKTIDGLQSRCKECYKKEYAQKRHTKDYIQKDRYRQLCGRVRRGQGGGSGKPILSEEEWRQFCRKTDKQLNELLNLWEKSGYKRDLAISVDRIDNAKGYEVGNLQWLSTLDNTMKYVLERKNFQKIIVQDVNGKKYEFANQTKAAIFLGVSKTTVKRALKNGSKIKKRYTILWV